MSSPAPRRVLLVLLAVVAGSCLLAASAASAKPATGRFTTTTSPGFSFTITKDLCWGAPRNLNDPNARAGAKKRGFCFAAMTGPKVDPVCPPPGSITGAEAAIAPMTGLRLSPSGVLHVKAYEFGGGDDAPPVGYTELSLKVTGKKASGFVRYSTTIAGNDGVFTCDTGKVPFSAKVR